MCVCVVAEYGPQGLVDVRYDVMELPITLPFQKPPADKPNPKQGIGKLHFIHHMLAFSILVEKFYI